MTTRTSASLKQAFKRFVKLVEPIEDVRHVVAFDDGGIDVFTHITRRDEAVMSQVHHAEFRIMEEYPDLPVLFHVRYLEGKHLDLDRLPPLSYSKDPLAQGTVRSAG